MGDTPNFGALRDRRLWKKLENGGMYPELHQRDSDIQNKRWADTISSGRKQWII